MSNQYNELKAAVERLLLEILKHGFGEFEIRVHQVKHRKRDVTLQAGKTEKFTIPESDLP